MGYFFLKWLFPLIYALTVTPFTVQLFRRFVSSPQVNLNLFNLSFLPLPKVHEFFLPFFILSLELISIQLATVFWSRIDWGQKVMLVLVLAGFQLFPFFSVYFDARITAYDSLKSSQPLVVSAEEENRVNQDYQTQVSAYNAQLASQQQDYNQAYAAYQAQDAADQQRIGSLQVSIDAINAHINADQYFALNNPGQRAALEGQIADYRSQIAQYQQEQADLQGKVAARKPPAQPVAPPPPVKAVPKSQPAPLPYSGDIDFILKTLTQPESLLSLFISLIFPIIVLGAGFVLARAQKGERGHPEEERGSFRLNLERELEIGGRLPGASQSTFVDSLKPIILSYFEALQSSNQLALTNTVTHLENEHGLELVEALALLKRQVFTSKLTKEAKDRFDLYIDHLIATQTFQTQQTQPI